MTDPSVAESLERIIFAGVAMTTVAITSARPGFDLTFPQWRVVVILGNAPDGARISDVARQVGVTLPATSRQLRRLERRGLVTVTPDELDRRVAIACLTAEGQRARASVIAHRKAMIVALATPLESDPVARRELARVADALDVAPMTGLRRATSGGCRRGRRRQTGTAIDTSPGRRPP
jgi:DNA-binding MarR family transcriptional regulator